jgi:oligopeptide/dipeptide ABC transporter ATP-binding protein
VNPLSDNELLRINHLQKYYTVRKGLGFATVNTIKAVDDISFSVHKGEVFGLVGESGCGKTTTANLIARAIEPTGGEIFFRSSKGVVDMAKLSGKQLREVRRDVQMVFQDPYSSLNPRLSVFNIIAEPLICAGIRGDESKRRVAELMDMVGLNPAYMERYPHAFSGGQRQRIGIARAMALSPALVLADEPVSSLDVSVQAQILNLIMDLKQELGITYIFIGHDLAVIRYVCDRIAVMYTGKIVELTTADALFSNPLHPYTQTLLSAVPDANPHQPWMVDSATIDTASFQQVHQGCPFAPRCPLVEDYCRAVAPELENVNEGQANAAPHWVSCHKVEKGPGGAKLPLPQGSRESW